MENRLDNMAPTARKGERLAGALARRRRVRRLLVVLGIMAVLATAISLMLPAVSMTRGDLVCSLEEHAHSASCYEKVLVCGMEEDEGADPETDEGGHVHAKDCYEKQLVCEIPEHKHSDACYEQVEGEGEGGASGAADDGADADPDDGKGETPDAAAGADADDGKSDESGDAEAAGDGEPSGSASSVGAVEAGSGSDMPAQSFKADLKDKDGKVTLTVEVEAPEGAFPAGTFMKIDGVPAKDVADAVQDAVRKSEGVGVRVKSMTAVDIVFREGGPGGKQIEPAKKVKVKITSPDVRDFDDPMLVHVVDKSRESAKGKTEDAEVVEKVKIVNQDEDDKTTGAEDTMQFKADEFSPYVIVELESIEASYITADGEAYKITVACPPEAGIPGNAKLEVSEIAEDDTGYKDYVAGAEEALGMEEGATYVRLFDIKIVDPDGNKLQPAEGSVVDVRIELADAESDSLDVVHFADGSGEGDVVSNSTEQADEGQAVNFSADEFSVYVVVDREGEDGAVVTPRVEFHYIDPTYMEHSTTSMVEGNPVTTYTYEAPGYEFVNKHGDNQITQIIRDGEGLEKIANPPNKKDASGHEASFFYGWYTADASVDTTAYDSDSKSYSGAITYTWENPKIVRDETPITISAADSNGSGTINAGDEVTWAIGDTSGTAVLDDEGTAHVYLVPAYEDFRFLNFHMGTKDSDPGLRNNLLTRKLIVYGQSDSADIRIGNVQCPSPDPAHKIFAGWETITSENETDEYYETTDVNGNEVNHPESGIGYYITVEKTGSMLSSVDLYPVFAEARWVYFNLGKSSNGAVYVPAAYLLTNDQNKGTSFSSLPTTSRAGYDFGGWYVNTAMVDNDIKNLEGPYDLETTTEGGATTTTHYSQAIQLTDAYGAFVNDVKGKVFYTTGSSTEISYGSSLPSGATKLFEVASDGKLYAYTDLDSLTLGAKWDPHMVDYTVVYWLQNANDDGYTLMHYELLHGIAGNQTQAAEVPASSQVYSDNKLRFTHLSDDQDKETNGNQSGIQQQVIAGDNSTIVNVYYDRDVYRVRFDIGFARRNNNNTWTYSVSNITAPNYAANNTWDQWLTNNRYDLGTTNPFGESEYTGTYETMVNNTRYIVYYYEIEAKYGQNIMDVYPGSQPVRANGNNRYSFVGWLAQRDSYYNARLSTSLKGYFETITEDLILTGGTIPGYNATIPNVSPDNYQAITVDGDNTITNKHGITQEFRCRYTTLNNAKKYLYRIYLADSDSLRYPNEPNDKFVITGGSGSNPNIQTPPTYYGYTLVDTKLIDQNGREVVPTANNYSDYQIPELTEAGVGNGMIMVFRFQPNKHSFDYKYGSGADPSLVNTDVGEGTTYNYGQSLANADIYTDLALANVPEGHSFVGWYENPDGVGNAFDFDTTMPDGDIVLYAVYKPIRYRIMIDPNGAEIDHIDHTGASYSRASIAPFNRTATDERPADSGYNTSQATYFNGTYGETVGEYAVSRSYVPISDSAAEIYKADGGRLYRYVNMQYKRTDGSGVPADLRDALYVDVTDDEAELQALYNFWHSWVQYNWELDPGAYPGMTAQSISYEQWKSLYVDDELYRKCNSKEAWVFLGWFKDGESMPYNFSEPISDEFTLTAHWRLDGGYTIQYTPEYYMENGDLINGQIPFWVDPTSESGTLSYTDGAPTSVFKQPTDLTRNGVEVTDNSLVFRGWRIVGVTTTTDDQGNVVSTTYTPLEDGVYYDPGDDFTVRVEFADSNNVIHMQAVYEEVEGSYRRPEVANLTLDANSGYLVDADGNELTSDANLIWDKLGTIAMDASDDQIVFGDIQSNTAVHLYKYAARDVDSGLTGGANYFKHPYGYFLLGFDPQRDPDDIVWVDKQDDSVTGAAQPYVPNYPANSVISVQRTDDKTIYAIWEPMVYATFVNDTDGTVSFGLSATDSSALQVINVKDGMYNRTPLADYGNITLAAGESIMLAFPKGAEKSITVSGTNELGAGKILLWDTKLTADDVTYDTATTDAEVTYTHTVPGATESDDHVLAEGQVDNGKAFSFDEKLLINDEGLTITFTHLQRDRTLVFDDNYAGGGVQEQYFANDELSTATATTPSNSTRFGYELKGWAWSNTATEPDYEVGAMMSGLDDIFGDEIVKTLYAVWEAKAESNTVYVYKTVPSPGSQSALFTFTVNVSGTYTYDDNRTGSPSASGSFTLASGEYAKLYSTEWIPQGVTSRAYLQTEVTVYKADGSPDQSRSLTIKAEVNRNGRGSFNGTEKFTVTEASVDNYTPTVEIAAIYSGQPINAEGGSISWGNPYTGGTVIYTNSLKTYDVTVDKTMLVGGVSTSSMFNFTAGYELDGDTTDLGSFTVTSGTSNTAALAGIPAGAVLTVSEAQDDNYDTVVSVNGGTAQDGKSASFAVTGDSVVAFTNTLKSYPVKFVKVDQDGAAGTVEANFKLDASTYSLGRDLVANSGNQGVFYTSGGENKPLYAGETYTLEETWTHGSYIGLNGPVTIEVSGTSGNEFTFSDPNVAAEYASTDGVWVIKVTNRAKKNITVKKALVDPLTSQRTFVFNYSYVYNGTTTSGDFTLTPTTAAQASTMLSIPVGATDLTVTEILMGISDIYSIVAEGVKDSDGSTIVDADTDHSNVFKLDQVTDDATISFSNTRNDPKITLSKVDENGEGRSGATFTIFKKNGDVYVSFTMIDSEGVYIPSAGEGASNVLDLATVSSAVLKLPNGDYKLVETKAPAGYIVLSSDIEFTVFNGNVTLPTQEAVDLDRTNAVSRNEYVLTVANTPGKELPSTGGMGNMPLMLLGIALVIGAAAFLVARRKPLVVFSQQWAYIKARDVMGKRVHERRGFTRVVAQRKHRR